MKKKKYISAFYYSAFIIINYCTTMPFEFQNGYEQLIGLIISTGFLYVLNQIIFIIAFKITGILSDNDLSEDNSTTHWVIRCILALFLFGLCSTPLFSFIITPLIPLCYNLINSIIDRISNSISESFTNTISPPTV